MFINDLNENKYNLSKEIFKKEENKVRFSNSEFRIYDQSFNGGIIDSNCKGLKGEDLKIIDCFDIEKLNDIENDLEYLMNLVKSRKEELHPIEIKIEINTSEFRDGRKKMITIRVDKRTIQKDIYGDEHELRFENLEYCKYVNTKEFQNEISNEIAELKEKYKIFN